LIAKHFYIFFPQSNAHFQSIDVSVSDKCSNLFYSWIHLKLITITKTTAFLLFIVLYIEMCNTIHLSFSEMYVVLTINHSSYYILLINI